MEAQRLSHRQLHLCQYAAKRETAAPNQSDFGSEPGRNYLRPRWRKPYGDGPNGSGGLCADVH